jgi:hypothetical protein
MAASLSAHWKRVAASALSLMPSSFIGVAHLNFSGIMAIHLANTNPKSRLNNCDIRRTVIPKNMNGC